MALASYALKAYITAVTAYSHVLSDARRDAVNALTRLKFEIAMSGVS
jgi:hypothetical protein